MRIEELNKDLKRAYQTMVDTVEELVVKDGKNLQQAMHSAEEKLSEWNELSKEQVQEISTELKHDFQTLNENLNEAKESYKEEFKKDAAYVTDSIWGKLMKITDSNTEQLLVFEETLKEQAQAVTSGEHLTEHQEHTQWNSEHELWLAEIALWKKEHAEAFSKLEKIEAAISQHSDDLDEHAQVIQAHEARDHEHEEVMAKAEQDPSSKVFEVADDKEVAVHKQERQEHHQHAELHNTMKKHHSEMMSLVNKLYKQTL